jgi:hypothetical protein
MDQEFRYETTGDVSGRNGKLGSEEGKEVVHHD